MQTILGKFFLFVSLLFILFSFFAPFVLLPIFQQVFIQPESTWFFGNPFKNYGIYFVVFLYIGIAIGVFRHFFFNYQKKVIIIACFAAALVPAIAALMMAVDNYFYLDDEGIHYDSLLELTEEIHYWENVEKMTVVTEDTAGGTEPTKMAFTKTNGQRVIFPMTSELFHARNSVERRLLEKNIALDAVYKRREP